MLRSTRFNKIGISTIALIFVFSMLLAACGSGGTNTGNNPPPASTTNTPATTPAGSSEELEEVNLVWYFPGNFPQTDQDKVFAEVNKVIKEKINATVEFKAFPFGDYDQKMQVVIASGENYDLAFTAGWINNYNQNVAKGAFLPLDDLLAKYAPKSLASMPESMWSAVKIKGQIYGFINQQISARTPAISVERKLAEKYGLDLDGIAGKLTAFNFDLFEPYLAAVHKDSPEKAFIAPLASMMDIFGVETIVGPNVPGAVSFTDGTLKVINQFESDEALAFAATMRDWNSKGYMNSKSRISTKKDEWADAQAGKWAMNIDGAYKPGGDVGASSQAGVPYIVAPAGTAYLTTGGISATLQAINRNSKNPERAMMLLELLNTDKDLFNLLNFGIKGEHYEIDADGFLIPGSKQKAYNPQVAWMFATNFLAHVEKGMPATVWEDTKRVNDEAIPSNLLGFSFDSEPVKGEIAQTSAVYDEYSRAIELGVSDEAKYNEFLAKLKTAGSDKIIAEMQAQIDAWKASK